MNHNSIRMRDINNQYTSLNVEDDDQNEIEFQPRKKKEFEISFDYLKFYVYENWSSIFPILIFVLINAFIVLMFILFHEQVLNGLQDLGNYLKTLGYAGMLIPIVLIIIASFPPIPGYGTVSVLCGFVYDFPIGFIPPLIGGIIGASSCFVVSRKYGQTYIRKLLAHYTYIEAAMKAIEIKGTKLLFLVRVAPYPWTIMNFVLGATKIPYTKFILATTLSLPKLLFHVYLGASAKSLLDNGATYSPTKIVMAVFALVSFIGVTVYLYFTCTKIINNTLDLPSRTSSNNTDMRHSL